jgi:hypothetical protein
MISRISSELAMFPLASRCNQLAFQPPQSLVGSLTADHSLAHQLAQRSARETKAGACY